jgi:hypothetical protein
MHYNFIAAYAIIYFLKLFALTIRYSVNTIFTEYFNLNLPKKFT